MPQEDICSFFGCGNIATEKCPGCEMKLCLDHKPMHGHIGQIPDEKKESYSSLLGFHRTTLMDKIRALRVFNDKSSNMVEDYLASVKEKFERKVDTLNDEEKEEYKVRLSLEIVAPTVGGYKIKHPRVAKIHAEETEMYNHREYIRRESKEMVLVYLVIIFEEFLSNLLSALFMKRHDTLKESGKSILFKDALEHTDINELVKTMSKEEAKDIVEKDIEKLSERLENRFKLGLNLDKRNDWPKFKEFFYRRNIVVHNYGYPDSTYIEKTKFKGEKDYWLEIDNSYLNGAFSVFENYANEIAHSFDDKFGNSQ